MVIPGLTSPASCDAPDLEGLQQLYKGVKTIRHEELVGLDLTQDSQSRYTMQDVPHSNSMICVALGVCDSRPRGGAYTQWRRACACKSEAEQPFSACIHTQTEDSSNASRVCIPRGSIRLASASSDLCTTPTSMSATLPLASQKDK